MIRALFSADWHDSPEFHAQVKPAVDYFVEKVREIEPDFVGLPGDFFVKRGHLNPMEMVYVRTAVHKISMVCPVIIMPGNHDEVHSASAVDSLSGVFSIEGWSQPIPNVWVVTRPQLIDIPVGKTPDQLQSVQVLVCPYPSRQLWAPGKELSAHEQHETMTDLVGQMVRGMAKDLHPDKPSVFMFHGSIDQGKAGPEVYMTSELEVVIRQTDIPEQATLAVGGHLHLPQKVGRFLYTGAPCSHTFSTERLEPSFLEVRFYAPGEEETELDCSITIPSIHVRGAEVTVGDEGDATAKVWGENPNKGHEVTSEWSCRYMRHPIPVAIPLLTVDIRGQDLGDTPTESALAVIAERAAELKGTRVRFRMAVPVAFKDAADEGRIKDAIMLQGAESARVLIETKPEIVVRSADIHAGVTFNDGLEMWLKTQPDYVDHKEALLGLASEVDASLTAEQRQLHEPIDVRTLRLGWSNWKQYGEDNVLDFQDLKGLIAVVGPNMAGKSNLAELAAFCRWGTLRAGLSGKGGRSRLKFAVRTGCRDMKAWEEFEANGEVYRIDRSVTWTGRTQKSTLTLAKRVVAGTDPTGDVVTSIPMWQSISGNDARETQKKIDAIVGGLQHYLSTSFSSQFDLTRILDMGEADFQATLQEACNTDVWDTREDAVKVLHDQTREDLAASQATGAAHQKDADARDDRKVAVQNLETQVKSADQGLAKATEKKMETGTALQSVKEEQEKIPEERDALKVMLDKFEAAGKLVDDAKARKTTKETALGKANLRLNESKKATAEIPAWEKKASDLDKAESVYKTQVNLRQKRDDLVKQSLRENSLRMDANITNNRQRAEWTEKRRELAETVADRLRELNSVTDTWKRMIGIEKGKVTEAEKRIVLLGDVKDCRPPAYRTVTSGGEPQLLNPDCPLLKDAFTAQESLPRLKKGLEEMSMEPDYVRVANDAWEKAKAALATYEAEVPEPPEFSMSEKRHKSRAEELRQEADDVGYDPDLLGVVQEKIEEISKEKPRERLAALREALDTQAERQEAVEAAENDLKAAEGEVSRLEKDARAIWEEYEPAKAKLAEKVADIDRRLVEAREADSDAQVVLEAAQGNRSELGPKLGAAQERLRASELAREALKSIRVETDRLHRRSIHLSILRQACSRTGIPYLILEKALPLFEQKVNTYLEGTELQIQVIAQGDEGLERGFTDDAGWHPISEASGFAKAVLGITMRWALCHVAAAFTGTTIRQFTQDEGFGAFHQSNYIVAQRLLRDMVESGVESMIVISHVPAVVEAADHILTVVRDPNGNYVEGPGASR